MLVLPRNLLSLDGEPSDVEGRLVGLEALLTDLETVTAAPPAAGYVLHLAGQSNAANYALGAPPVSNTRGMRFADGTLINDTNTGPIEERHGIEHHLAGTWVETTGPILVKQSQGGIRADYWLQHHLAPWEAQVDALTVPDGFEHLLLWILGESNAFEQRAEDYEPDCRAIFDGFRSKIPTIRIVDVLLSGDYMLSQRTFGPTPHFHQIKARADIVNAAKLTLSQEFDTSLIGGDLTGIVSDVGGGDFETDRVHYSAQGLGKLAVAFRNALPNTAAGTGGSGSTGGGGTVGTVAFINGTPEVTSVNDTAVQVSFDTDANVSFEVYAQPGLIGDVEPLNTLVDSYYGADGSSYVRNLTGLQPGTDYRIRVDLLDPDGIVSSPEIQSATTGTAAFSFTNGSPTVGAVSEDSIELSITTNEASSIRVYADTGASTPTTLRHERATIDQAMHTPTITGLAASTEYRFLVEVTDDDGTTLQSEEFLVTTSATGASGTAAFVGGTPSPDLVNASAFRIPFSTTKAVGFEMFLEPGLVGDPETLDTIVDFYRSTDKSTFTRIITGLSASTDYRVRIDLLDPDGRVVGDEFLVTTTAS